MITYQKELLKDILPEFEELLKPHMEEISIPYRDGEELAPDYNRYFKMQELGLHLLMTCRNDGELIGYIGFFVHPSIRYSKSLTAYEDLYYLKPEYRGRQIGYKLFTESEKLLKKRDVKRIIISCKVFQDHSKIFDSLGYEFYEKHFTKNL